ncbi:hypothetical protein Tco_1403657 [Tanacetum coccineum]
MSTQQDIFAVGSENRPHITMRTMFHGHHAFSGDADRKVPVNETFHEQTDDELTKKELKQVEADDQAIQTILLGLPEDIYAVVDSCKTAQEIWLRAKGSDIGIQEKKAKLNKHFPEKIASNLKFLNNLQLKWSRHVTIVHQTKETPIGKLETEGEITAAVLKEAIKVNSMPKDFVVSNINDDGFVTVGRKNKPIEKNQVPPQVTSQVKQAVKVQNRGGLNSGRQYGSGFQHNVQQKNSVNANKNDTIGKSGVKFNVGKGSSAQDVKKGPLIVKPGHASVYNKDFRPKVLVRGSNSDSDTKKHLDEAVPISNSFDLLSDEAMDEEYATSIWPKLKGDVDDLMENGIYPTKEIRAEWSLRQMEYFYNNCHKFHLDPAYEDEEDDVNSEVDGVASDMKPEFKVNDAKVLVNDSAKDQVIQLLREDAYSLCGLLETHVKKKNLHRICNRVLGNWEWVSNISSCNGGTRIIVGWDPNSVNVMVLEQSSQVLHCLVEPVNGDSSFFCSFVYAAIHTVILGDFNACLDPSERSSGCPKVTTAMNDFRDCVSDIKVEDIAMSGHRFTWNKKSGLEGGLLKKLDRVLGNSSFMTLFPSAYAQFLPFMLSDHTPTVFVIPEVKKLKPKPFKFHNYLSSKDAFIPTVSGVWSNKVGGFSMFSLVSKLKMLKRPLRKLNYDQGNLFENVKRLRSELASAQTSLCADPHNRSLREIEAKTFKAYKSALKDEESFLKLNRNIISYVEDLNGNAFHGLDVGEQFVFHFKSVLGMSFEISPIADPGSLFIKFLHESEALNMIRAVSDDEIKNALFSIDGNKAPGPDGFFAQFFQDAWTMVGSDICKAVKDFFVNGKLLKEVNATVIALVPKIATPSKVSDYRPIACCNVVYKIISKIISNRLKNVLGLLVDENQCAFIPSRQISDNILLS